MSKVKKYLTIVGLCVVIILCSVYIIYALNLIKKKPVEIVPVGLTSDERNQILEKLSKPGIDHPISNVKAKEVLKDLHDQIPKGKILTIEQKEALLKKLNQK